MKIENVRVGLATNSSSTHSIIFNLDAHSRDWEDGEFGWNEFCCNCGPSKRMYLGATLWHNLQHLGEDIARAVVQSWVDAELPPAGEYGSHFVDHGGLMTLPIDSRTELPDKEFFDELLAYYLKPEVAIVGGNDNEEPRIFTEGRHDHMVDTDSRNGIHLCRKDPNTGHWVLFNRRTGTKIRMHFDKNAPDYTKACAPELVDIKITDYCPHGCSYCYQDSALDGSHCDMDFIQRLAWDFKDLGVFEVALGGGEPTMHPKFAKILQKFRNSGIVPNFTTRSYKWLKNTSIREAVKEYAGKFAISISNLHDMQRAWHIADAFKMVDGDFDYDRRRPGCRLGFQYVMGSSDLNEFAKILKRIPWNTDLTLLGYKEKGRGSSYKPYSYSGWLKTLLDVADRIGGRVGIDTALANQHKDAVLEAVDKSLVTFEEGKFSMYVDAVSQRAAPSSYCSEEETVDVAGKHGRDWLRLFERF